MLSQAFAALALITVTQANAIDGDTITIGSTRVRIANIDAPEIEHPKCAAELKLGLKARERMRQLLGSGTVTMKLGDPKNGRLIDWFGRTLATISIDGRDVGAIMIAEGLAREWTGKRRPLCRDGQR